MFYDKVTKRLVIADVEIKEIKKTHKLKKDQVFVVMRVGIGKIEIVVTPSENVMPTFAVDVFEPQTRLIIPTRLMDNTLENYIEIENVLDDEEQTTLEDNEWWVLTSVTDKNFTFSNLVKAPQA